MVDLNQVKETVGEWSALVSEVPEYHFETHLPHVRGVHLVPDEAELLAVGLGQVEGRDGLDESRGAVGQDDIASISHERSEEEVT